MKNTEDLKGKVQSETPKKYFGTKDTAKYFGVSSPTILKWANEGVITCIKVPGTKRRLFDIEKVKSQLEKLES